MAHHQKQQADAARRGSAIQSLFKMFNISTAPTVPIGDDDVAAEADEPPDDRLSPLQSAYPKDSAYPKAASKPTYNRRESLLTRAIQSESKPDVPSPLSSPHTSRGLSTTSSHSTGSMASTAELTSDGDLTSPNRSATPSPPLPTGRFHHSFDAKTSHAPPSKVVIAPVTKDDKPDIADVGEAAVEKTLGRKRCIMFACSGKSPEKKESIAPSTAEDKPHPEPPKRKSMISFACPMRQQSSAGRTLEPARSKNNSITQRKASPAPASKRRLSTDMSAAATDTTAPAKDESKTPKSPSSHTSPHTFHEFGISQDETDAWVHETEDHKDKLTLSDCMKKENAIRQLGEEAEEEAEEEERAQEELEEETDEEPHEDDFAPSDDSDAGNESDDEGGFAESDDESDTGSDYQFWAPSTTTATTSTENLNMSHFSLRTRSRAGSLESTNHSTSPNSSQIGRPIGKRRPSKVARMRPGTPELPDSTDFVCGTLDEDRPLEAAFIACREQKKREKHVPIPQDIDPSFPTTDPEDNDDAGDEEESFGAGGPMWLNNQFTEFDQEHCGTKSVLVKSPAPPSPKQDLLAPRPVAARRTTPRSPPPRRGLCRSPPPRKLFGHSPSRMRSPPLQTRLRSPPASPTTVEPSNGMAISHLAQRPVVRQGPGGRTSSLPRTPNPFFQNFKVGSASISNVASGAVTPAAEEPPKADMHVRGPVDIVMGLEKKRQKRKEKFWRQHCRKVAREQAERKPIPGRGAERMKELGLECAERNRGYGLGQQQLVISL